MFPQVVKKIFPGGGTRDEIYFFMLEAKKTTFLLIL